MNFLRPSFLRSATPPLWVLVIMTSVGPFGDTEYTPSLPRIAHSLNVSYSAAQQSMTTYLLAFAVMQLIYGPLSDRIGRKPVALWGAFLFTVGSYVCWVSMDLDTLLIGRFLQGLGSCAGAIISSAAVRDSYPVEKIEITYAKINAAFALAPALGPVIGAIVDDHYGWHANMLILLILGFLLFATLFFFFPETHVPDKAQQLLPKRVYITYTKLFRHADFLPAIFINGIAIGVVYTSLTEAPALVTDTLGLPSSWIAVVAIAILIAFITGSLIGVYLEKKISPKQIMQIGLFLILASSILLATAGFLKFIFLWGLLLPIMLSFVGIALIVPNAVATAMRPFEHIAGAASAMTGFSQMTIAALSNIGVSLLPFDPIYALSTIFLILASLGMLTHKIRF